MPIDPDDQLVDPSDLEVGEAIDFENTAVSAATTAVRHDEANQAPSFVEGNTAIRYVLENRATNMNIGDPVVATDGDDDTPVYTLGTTGDNLSFDIDTGTGQLKTKAALNHETKSSYSVRITADDSSGASNNIDTITVTIRVVDVDEPPVITNREQPNIPHEVTIAAYGE